MFYSLKCHIYKTLCLLNVVNEPDGIIISIFSYFRESSDKKARLLSLI